VLGHEAHGAPSAEAALAQLAQQAADVLFTDLNLPGMSGDRLAGAASALRPNLRIILASGEGIVDIDAGIQTRLHAGPIVQLPKPYDLAQLEATLAAIGADLLTQASLDQA
jgi:DNA-binding NtrC family response regulator